MESGQPCPRGAVKLADRAVRSPIASRENRSFLLPLPDTRHSTPVPFSGILHSHETKSHLASHFVRRCRLSAPPGFLELEKGRTAHLWLSADRPGLSRGLFHPGRHHDGRAREIRLACPP